MLRKCLLGLVTKHFFSYRKFYFLYFFVVREFFKLDKNLAARKKMFCHY